MWKNVLMLLMLLLTTGVFLASSGCTDNFAGPDGLRNGTSLSAPQAAARYAIGDVVIGKPSDMTGQVVVDYSPETHTYTTKTVIFDQFGNLYSYSGGGTYGQADLEAKFPHLRAHSTNPYDLPAYETEYSPKYGIGQVVTEERNPGEGLMILAYDYPRDVYTFAYARQQGGRWVYDQNETYEGARTDIERRFVTE